MCPLLVRALSLKSDRTLQFFPSNKSPRLLLLFPTTQFPWLLFFPLLKGFCFSPFSQTQSIRCISNVKDSWQEPQMGKSGVQVPLHRWSWPVEALHHTRSRQGHDLLQPQQWLSSLQHNAWHTRAQKTTPRTHHSSTPDTHRLKSAQISAPMKFKSFIFLKFRFEFLLWG